MELNVWSKENPPPKRIPIPWVKKSPIIPFRSLATVFGISRETLRHVRIKWQMDANKTLNLCDIRSIIAFVLFVESQGYAPKD